ncbi:unnamed protein product [Lactuca virosa]|uniref:Uncharacterized protein n=1 Tax=Lactuca virosa TaxID=75947 RepID=A0AAU9N176_9ASTR|nr:unnamed protein product [Lactuca virosa]
MQSINSSTIIQASSSVNLTSATKRLKRKPTNISAIPMFDLKINEDINDQHTHANIPKGVSKDYIDHGDQNVVCQICFRQEDASISTSDSIDLQIIHDLKLMLDSNNVLVQCYRMVKDSFQVNPYIDLKLRFIGKRIQDGMAYNLPSASEVAALIVGDIDDSFENRDIIVQTSSRSLQRISELHPSYLTLQYPLLFPYRNDGYKEDILHRGLTSSSSSKRPNAKLIEKSETSVDEDGFPIYRRRNDGSFVEKSGIRLDNRHVVVYKKDLLKRYQGHINVEWCNQASSIKYLFKYINKGLDRATLVVIQSNNEGGTDDSVNEIKEYYDCRYIFACEASWIIFGYDIHYRYPAVVRLPFHLPGQQQVIYDLDDDIDNILNKPSVASSMFTSWLESVDNDLKQKEGQLLSTLYIDEGDEGHQERENENGADRMDCQHYLHFQLSPLILPIYTSILTQVLYECVLQKLGQMSHSKSKNTLFPFPPNVMRRKLVSRWLGGFSLGIDLGLSRTGLAISKGFSVRPLKVFDLDFIMCVSTLGSGIKGPKA